MFLPNTQSFLLVRGKRNAVDFSSDADGVATAVISHMHSKDPPPKKPKNKIGGNGAFLPNTQSFLWVREERHEGGSSTEAMVISEMPTEEAASAVSQMAQKGRFVFLPSSQSFLWVREERSVEPISTTQATTVTTTVTSEEVINVPSKNPDGTQEPEGGSDGSVDANRRKFLKTAGMAGAGIIASQLLPKKADALILGSSPTTGVVGVKNSSNVRVNPATEETLDEVLKTTDLDFDGSGNLNVNIAGSGSSSFSDSLDVAKQALVDGDRHVQVDVLSSALPSSASTESTLQTISFGGVKYSLRMVTSGVYDYIGEASVGSATSSAVWRVKRVDNTSGNVSILWADGDETFDNVWDNYASLSYS